jgi:hypothetical protein
MEECTGKALLEEKLKSITEENSKFDVVTTKVTNELVEKLNKALCCVTFPVIEKYFSWKHLRFKTKILNKNVIIKLINSDPKYKNVLVLITAARPGYEYDYKSIKLDFIILAWNDKNGDIKCKIRHDGDEYTPDEVLNKVIKEIANYTISFNKVHNVN